MHLRLSHAAFAAICSAAPLLAQHHDGGLYYDDDGLIVIEMESTPHFGNWAEETIDTGFTFESYYRWDGPDLFGTPGVDKLAYRVHLSVAGEWFLSLRNRHDDPDDTMENDTWIRVDGGTWYKLFSNSPGSVGQWIWQSRLDIPGQPQASWNLSAGEHLIEFSGRSKNFKMDRFHLYLEGNPHGKNKNRPETPALLGENYCGPAVDNSSGQPGVIDAWGSTWVVNNDVTLQATGLPTEKFGYFLTSRPQGFVPTPGGSQGNLCLSGNIGRYTSNVLNTGASGSVALQIDLNSIPKNPPDAIQAGETWRFQLWFRDNNPTPTSNFTDGTAVRFQ